MAMVRRAGADETDFSLNLTLTINVEGCLFAKRLERGRFIWPQASEGSLHLSGAQLSMLLEGIDWRRPSRTWQPERAA